MDDTMISDERVRSRADELRMWLVVSSAFTFCFFLVLTSVDHPLDIVGTLLLIHMMMAVAVYYAFFRAAVVDALLKHTGQSTGSYKAIKPPCDGVCGYGGTNPAFIMYSISFALTTHRLASLYTVCALKSFRVHLSTPQYMELIMAFVCALLAVFFVELGKRANATEGFYA